MIAVCVDLSRQDCEVSLIVVNLLLRLVSNSMCLAVAGVQDWSRLWFTLGIREIRVVYSSFEVRMRKSGPTFHWR